MSEFWAAIAGALVGGGIAAVVQWLSTRHATYDRRRGLAYSLLLKVGQIYSHLRVLNRRLDGAFENATPEQQANAWAIVEGMTSPLALVTFSPDELALVLQFGDGKLANALLAMDEKHNAMFETLAFYGTKRAELLEALTPERIEGDHGVAPIPLAMQARTIGLNQIVASLRQFAPADMADALKVLEQLSALFEKRLSVKFEATPKPDPARAQAAAIG